ANPARFDAYLRLVSERAEAAGVRIGALFGPQHGFQSDVQENMIESPHAKDARWRVPVYSLYSETREPTAAMLAGLDAIVIDLQDVGTRIYTYIYTMANCLRAARTHGVPVVVCDRPNPIGGVAVEGPMLEPGFTSFVGQFPIPMRHGMTIGELARMFNEHFGLGAKLEVVAMRGWTRDQYFDRTGLTWIPPSPNIPTLDSAIVYPGTVLVEGTNVSEGRGTTRPFEFVGAPWVDPVAVAADLNGQGLPGVHFRAIRFEPTFHKHAATTCGGCHLHVMDRAAFSPVATGVAVIDACRRAGPDRFAWRDPPYEYEFMKPPVDILYGSARLREGLAAGASALDLAREWTDAVRAFDPLRARWLMY
ncbi:MAG: exo-beta-N-acetylmuramidase NamZ domain-containing protein, partial [Vicinamibacterales bacterium]